jgi:hypothetical protein
MLPGHELHGNVDVAAGGRLTLYTIAGNRTLALGRTSEGKQGEALDYQL